MANSLPQLVDLLQAFRCAASEAELGFARKGEVDAALIAVGDRLLGDEGRELFEEARGRGELSDEHARSIEQHLAWSAFELLRVRARPRIAAWLKAPIAIGSSAEEPSLLLSALLRADDRSADDVRVRQLERSLEAFAQPVCELRQRMDEVFSERYPGGEGLKPTLALAEAFLRDTDDASQDMREWLLRTRKSGGQFPAYDLMMAARYRELDGLARSDRRMYRIATGFRALGFESDMNARLRVETCRAWLTPGASALVISAPNDVRVLQSGFEYGVLSDLFAAECMGRALAHSLVSPALPWSTRMPVLAETPRAIGGLTMQLRAEAAYLRHFEGRSKSEAEPLARHTAVLLLLTIRASAAVTLALHQHARSSDERVENLIVALDRAWGVSVPAGFAAWLGYEAPSFGVELMGRLAGLAAHAALRERYDVDWFRNPRVAEPLRGLCARGNDLGITAMCEELGANLAQASVRMLELLS